MSDMLHQLVHDSLPRLMDSAQSILILLVLKHITMSFRVSMSFYTPFVIDDQSVPELPGGQKEG